MNIAEPFIRRPVMTSLVMASIALFGIMAYRQLPVSDLPNVDFPTIEVSASVPGASPETMASAVATVLERQFSTIAGVDSMISVSGQGSTRITLQFNLNRNIDAAAQDVQAAIARSLRRLPPDMPTPPSYSKVNPADFPFLFVALTSPTLPLSTLNEYGETLLAQRISMVDGVAQVMIYGGQKYAVRLQMDPKALASHGIGIDEVVDAVGRHNVSLPTGIMYGPRRALTIQANGQLMRAPDYRSMIVAYRNGAPVRLEEVGQAVDSVENDKVAAWYCTPENQQRTIMLAIQRQPGVNTVAVADAVKALLPSFKNQLPASVSLNILFDASTSIKESFNDIQFTLLLTLCLVVLVIFLFLRNVSATVIPSLALPMSVVGTFIVMGLLNYNLDNLSLMALTLAVGFVVDDAIVMLENIFRHMEMGKSVLQAALDGSKEVSFTIISMTLSLTAVFIPVLFMGGIVGRLFREFAVTIGAAVLISGFISLTLTPMLASRFLRPPGTVRHGRIYNLTERGFDAALRFYDVTLRWVLRHCFATLVLSLLILAGSVGLFRGIWIGGKCLYPGISKGFIPSEDRGRINVDTEGAQNLSHLAMFEYQKKLATIVQQEPNIHSFMSRAGPRGGSGAPNAGGFFIRLVDRDKRTKTIDQIIRELRPKLMAVPGVKSFLLNPPTIPIGGRIAKSQYQYTLQGPDTTEMYAAAQAMEEKIRQMPEFLDVGTDMQLANPELDVNINRDLASSLGLSAAQIEDALLSAYGSRQVSTIYAPDNQYQVIVELLPEFQDNPDALSFLHVRSTSGQLIPLSAVTELKQSVGPLTVNHSGQLPAVTISFNLKEGVSIGDAMEKINAVSATTVPPTILCNFQGTAQAFQSSLKGMGVLLILAVVVIYVVLGILYEDLLHPVTILSALPLAGFGALLTLIVFNTELSLYAYIGIIMLVGLVKKNGIMMIDFALEVEREKKLPPAESIHEACLIRFRPIMMTTVSALMAGLPIALGYGAGGEARRPLGLAVVGGLLFSQTLTLYVTPVFYIYMERLHKRLRRRRHAGKDGAGGATAETAVAASAQ